MSEDPVLKEPPRTHLLGMGMGKRFRLNLEAGDPFELVGTDRRDEEGNEVLVARDLRGQSLSLGEIYRMNSNSFFVYAIDGRGRVKP